MGYFNIDIIFWAVFLLVELFGWTQNISFLLSPTYNYSILLKYLHFLCFGGFAHKWSQLLFHWVVFFFVTTTYSMSLLVNNVCFYWYYILSGFLSFITNIQADCHSSCMVAWLRFLWSKSGCCSSLKIPLLFFSCNTGGSRGQLSSLSFPSATRNGAREQRRG